MNQPQYSGSINQGSDERQEGLFTVRTRTLSEEADHFARRMERILRNIRGLSSPTPATSIEVAKVSNRESCIDDYLHRQESTHKSIEAMLNEMETLL
jgi:hypothetical protein